MKPDLRCPTCGKRHGGADLRLGPFCTERCQLVDLGRWLAEDYRIPDPSSAPVADERDPEGA